MIYEELTPTNVGVVPVAGIEPALPKKRHFECRVSTNSTTLARTD